MFISNSKFMKKFVMIVASLVCGILTIASIIAYNFSAEKQPFYVIIPAIVIIDITWILVYHFYVSKK